GAQGLQLGDGHRSLVIIAALGPGHVIPAALRGLGVGSVLGRPGEDVLEFGAPVFLLLLAIGRGQKQHGEAVAVHVAAGLAGVVGVADQPVPVALLTAGHQPVHGPADILGVFAVTDGRAFHEQGLGGDAGHGHGILVAVGTPVAIGVLLLG